MTREQTEMTQADEERIVDRLMDYAGKTRNQVTSPRMTAREAIVVADTVATLQAELERAKAENDKLRNSVRVVNSQAEEFERRWYLATHALEQAEAENERLRELLLEAANEIEDWGTYADFYFQHKHDLAGTVSRFRKAATPTQGDV